MDFYDWVLFVHILAGSAWLGGLIYANALMYSTARAGEPSALVDTAIRAGRINRALLPPAGAVTILAGLYMVGDDSRWDLSDGWVLTALILALGVVALAIAFFVPETRSIEREVAANGPGPAVGARLRRIGLLARLVTVVLTFVLLLMIWRPGA